MVANLSHTRIQSDIIYGMNDWYEAKKKVTTTFSHDYGKVVLMLTLLCLLLIILSGLISLLAPKKLHVSFLDVGQGDAILIQTPSGHDMLIDGGADKRVLEHLVSRLGYFDRHLDVVVATHGDADHVTGLIPILEKYTVDCIIVSPVKSETGIFDELEKRIDDEGSIVHVAKKGDEIDFGDGVIAHIVHPAYNFQKGNSNTNDASVSMVITYGDNSVLLTGDLPSTYEVSLLGGVLPRHVSIYKAGHHGSKYSSGNQLLSYITPEYAVISAGKDNTYGHPDIDALTRLKAYSQEVISTVEKGTITFLLDGKSIQLETSK